MQARCYQTFGQRPCTSAGKTILGLTGATTIRPNIFDVDLGSSATPADNALLWEMQRSTAAGTSTAVTPQALDPADPASLCASGTLHTVEPTYTAGAILFYAALNQRASKRFQFDDKAPLKIPATANNGIGLYPIHASFTGNCDAMFYFAE